MNNPLEICRQVIETTDSFLQDASRHTLQGIKALVEERRAILAELDGSTSKTAITENDSQLIAAFIEQLNHQDKILKEMVKNRQEDITAMLNGIKRANKVFRKYKSRIQKPARFIDKKR